VTTTAGVAVFAGAGVEETGLSSAPEQPVTTRGKNIRTHFRVFFIFLTPVTASDLGKTLLEF
jgi:hypothetical protein